MRCAHCWMMNSLGRTQKPSSMLLKQSCVRLELRQPKENQLKRSSNGGSAGGRTATDQLHHVVMVGC